MKQNGAQEFIARIGCGAPMKSKSYYKSSGAGTAQAFGENINTVQQHFQCEFVTFETRQTIQPTNSVFSTY